jgi:hypothetical protein
MKRSSEGGELLTKTPHRIGARSLVAGSSPRLNVEAGTGAVSGAYGLADTAEKIVAR